jgi:uncharacterized membrane protein
MIGPRSEMSTRAARQLLGRSPVAFFQVSGSVSLLDEQTNSLVGVAISALLPPAVNIGILWVAYVFVRGGVLIQMVRPGGRV